MLVPQNPVFKKCQTWPPSQRKIWTEHSLLSNNYSLKCLNWSKPPKGRHRTLCFLSLSQNPGFVYGRWLVITCWFAWVRTCINKACATVQSSTAQIIPVRAKTYNILHLNGSLNRQGRWDPKIVSHHEKNFYLQENKEDKVKVTSDENKTQRTLFGCFRKRLNKT